MVSPQFETCVTTLIFSAISADALTVKAAFTEGLDEMGWLKRIWREGASKGKGRGIPLTDFRGVLESTGYIGLIIPQMFVRHQAFP